MLNPYPFITNYGVTVELHGEHHDVHRGTYGFIRNQLAGGASIGATGTGGILVEPVGQPVDACRASRCSIRTPAWSIQRYYASNVAATISTRSGGTARKINLPPAFGWGSRIMGTAGVGALPGRPTRCSRDS